MKASLLSATLRKILCALLCLSILLSLPITAVATTAELSLSAQSAILMDADGRVIYEKNAGERMGMASTTKIMTALLVAESLPLDQVVAIPDEAVNTEGSSVYLCAGELLTVEQLLYALLLSSANDAAVALAIAVSGNVEDFASLMNQRASELGLRCTHFVNPHGLYHAEHYTTAYDLAVISAAALENDTVRKISATKRTTIPQGVTADAPDGAATRYLYNHNKMLSQYEGAIGLKTGFTKSTGRCLVSAAERDGLTLIAVTLNAPDDWRDHAAMLDMGYSLYERRALYGVGEFSCSYPVSGGREQYVTLVNTEPIILTLPKDSAEHTCSVSAYQRFEIAPVSAGDTLALLTVTADGRSLCSPLVAAYAVEAARTKKK